MEVTFLQMKVQFYGNQKLIKNAGGGMEGDHWMRLEGDMRLLYGSP